MKRLLFVCTANSCRSQMAEGFARYYGIGQVEPFSAGIRPHPLDQMAVQVMQERGIDISVHYPKTIDDVPLDDVMLIVTLCPNALTKLPALPAHIHRLHWNIADPNAIRGGAPLSAYRQLRDELESKVKWLLPAMNNLPATSRTHPPVITAQRNSHP
ncbi:arsenate reductase ArsC [Candidatus Nitrospira bockiana]